MIERLFPEGIKTCSTDLEGDPDSLYPEEERCVRAAVASRRREFAQGRLCARQALSRLGIRNFPLLMGNDRAPIWPEGVVGSLSHCRGYCAAAVARKGSILGLGLDIEPLEALDSGLLALICTDSERSWLAESAGDAKAVLAKLIFSAKESVFKCAYPLTGVFLDFHDCAIRLDEDRGTFTATLWNSSLPQPWNGRELRGRFVKDSKYFYTGIVHSRASAG
jgi:4'-phosphopantetheinyl transferase EntD